MNVRALIALLVLAVLAPVVMAGAPAQQPAPSAALPASFGAWSASGEPSRISPADLDKLAGDKAAILREYGISAAERSDYSRGGDKATVTLYRMTDSSAAFGAYTYLREPAMISFAAGNSASFASGSSSRALVVVGNLLLDVASPSDRPAKQDLDSLARAVGQQASRAPYPTVPAFLPQSGLIAGSPRYVLGPMAFAEVFPVGAATQRDWIGFDKNAEAVIAHYRLPGSAKDSLLLLLVTYPTPQIAAEKYDNMNGWLALNGESSTETRPRAFGKRSGALVALVSGADSEQQAQALLDKIQYSSQVTWNEPSHTLTDPNIATMIVGAIMGTGFIMAMAIAAGIGFGGFRIFMKFLFPGKVFDRSDQIEILQLGLSGKRIDVEDFYTLDSSREG